MGNGVPKHPISPCSLCIPSAGSQRVWWHGLEPVFGADLGSLQAA